MVLNLRSNCTYAMFYITQLSLYRLLMIASDKSSSDSTIIDFYPFMPSVSTLAFVNVLVPHMENIFFSTWCNTDLSYELFSLLTFRLSAHDIVAPFTFSIQCMLVLVDDKKNEFCWNQLYSLDANKHDLLGRYLWRFQ